MKIRPYFVFNLFVAAIFALTAPLALSKTVELVTSADIAKHKSQTTLFKLSNSSTVIHKLEPSSDIINVSIAFDWALKDQKKGSKSLPSLLMAMMARGTKTYSQAQLFALQEKYGLSLGCSAGIDLSTCQFETINDYFEETIGIFASAVKEPHFAEDDFKVIRDRQVSAKESSLEDPSSTVNEAVNEIYYTEAHPYYFPAADAIKELKSAKTKDLYRAYRSVLNAQRMTFVVVSSMSVDAVKKQLEKHFSSVKGWYYKSQKTAYPKSADKNLSLVEREIPTSYVRIKIPAPSYDSKEAATSRLLFEILSEEMSNEIRTKRSLSYSAFAYTGQGQIGLGVFGISTSKPKESLKVLSDIITTIRSKEIEGELFEEYKRVFATSYFLGLETHDSLASGLLRSYYYRGDPTFVFEVPKQFNSVTPKDVQNLAKKILGKFKIGVIGAKDQIKEDLSGIL